jgi:hypothetical protein
MSAFTANATTFETELYVPESLEPRMESLLQREIPEFRWQDEAENWGKVRIVGTTIPPFEGITVSIARKEPPGPFKFRIILRHVTATSREHADRALHLLEHRVRLTLRSQYAGPYVPLPGNSMTRVMPSDYPPIFHFDFLVKATQGLAPSIESRLHDLVGLRWQAINHNDKQAGFYGRKEDMHGFTLIHIQCQDAPGVFRVFVDTTAASEERCEIYRRFLADKVQRAFMA